MKNIALNFSLIVHNYAAKLSGSLKTLRNCVGNVNEEVDVLLSSFIHETHMMNIYKRKTLLLKIKANLNKNRVKIKKFEKICSQYVTMSF